MNALHFAGRLFGGFSRRAYASQSVAASRAIRPQLETLEPRRVLAAIAMTDQEQLLLELVNRARANPAAEAAFYGIDLNETLDEGTISADAKQPLAPHQALINAAGLHSQDMLDNDYFRHVNLAGQDPSDRAMAAGYPDGVAENIGLGGSTDPIDQDAHVYERHEALFLSAGHRVNLLTPGHREMGPGIRYGVYTVQPPEPEPAFDINASIATEKFGNRGGEAFITGVAFTDAEFDDDFYTIGEGVGDLTISAVDISTGAIFQTETGASGGYALQVPNGLYTVTAIGDGIDTLVELNVSISDRNAKVDFDTTEPLQHNVGDDILGRNGKELWVAGFDGAQLKTTHWGAISSAAVDVLVADFNGDGLDDIAGRVDGDWNVGRSTGKRFATSKWGRWAPSVTWVDVQAADVNGDGKSDIIGRQNGNWWAAISDGTSFHNQMMARWSTNVTWTHVDAADFTGDGRDDIIGRTGDQWWVARSTGDGFVNEYWGRWSKNVQWEDVMVGDFDGNGRADIIGRQNGNWWVAASTGSSFVTTFWGRWSTNVEWDNVSVGDFNGDGRDDVIGQQSGNWWVSQSLGFGFQVRLWGRWSAAVSWDDVQVADVDGDGRDDIIGRANGTWWVADSNGNAFDSSSIGRWSSAVTWTNVTTGNFA